MSDVSVLAFTGSMRRGSFNRKLLLLGVDHLRERGASVTEVELREIDLPMFNEDLESEYAERNEPIPAVARLQDLFLSHDALLISCPEYNGGITPALKNAIDWASRRSDDKGGLACFRGKVCGLMSASPGRLGGIRGMPDTRRILSGIGVHVVPADFACPGANKALDEPSDQVLAGVRKVADQLLDSTAALKGARSE